MTEHLIDPTKPEEIVKEIFNNNKDIIDEYSKNFSTEILDFAEEYAVGYKKYLELDRLVAETKNKQRAWVAGLSCLLFENLLTSFKLFILGYQVPSGNMMRQVIENVALATLCSLDFEIISKRTKKETKTINFYQDFICHKPEGQSHKAIHYLELNHQKINIQQDAIEVLKAARKFFHNYSHPSQLGMANMLSFQFSEKAFMGGSFDIGKMTEYKKELIHRINFSKILPNFIEGLIFRVKKLPNI
jgi:hypothetical protein